MITRQGDFCAIALMGHRQPSLFNEYAHEHFTPFKVTARNPVKYLCRSQPCNAGTGGGRPCRNNGSPLRVATCRSFDPSKQHGIPRHEAVCLMLLRHFSPSFRSLSFSGRPHHGQTVTLSASHCVVGTPIPCKAEKVPSLFVPADHFTKPYLPFYPPLYIPVTPYNRISPTFRFLAVTGLVLYDAKVGCRA